MTKNKVDIFDLQDKLQSIETALMKAKILQADLTHNFLGEADEKKKYLLFSMEYTTSHYKGLIIQDNLEVIEQTLAEIKEIIKASDEVSKATTHK